MDYYVSLLSNKCFQLYNNLKNNFFPQKIDFFDKLPNEIFFEIFQFLPVNEDLPNVSLACKKFYEITNDESFWIAKIKFYNPNLSRKQITDQDHKKSKKDLIIENYKFLNEISSVNINKMKEYKKIKFYYEYAYKFISVLNFREAKKCLDEAYLIMDNAEHRKNCFLSFSNRLIVSYSEIGDFEKICEIICIKPNGKIKNHDTFFIDKDFIGTWGKYHASTPIGLCKNIKTFIHSFEKFTISDNKLTSEISQKIEKFLNDIALSLLESLLNDSSKSDYKYCYFVPILNIIECLAKTHKYQTAHKITEKLLEIIKTQKIKFDSYLYSSNGSLVIIFDPSSKKNEKPCEIFNEINAISRKTKNYDLLKILKELLPQKLKLLLKKKIF